MRHIVYIVLAIIFIGVSVAVINSQDKPNDNILPVACTMDARICPDGSAVGRIGPRCEFAACPTTATTTATTTIDDQNDMTAGGMINVASPIPGSVITSPLKITGEARGNWFFEASFPVTLVDWDGLIIGQGIAQAKTDWMTTEFVPFEATIIFTKPAYTGEQSIRGAIILKNDNPSGMASTSRSIEIPVRFQ